MPLQITGRHMTVTEEQKDYIDKKVNRLRRLCSNIDEMSVTLTKEKIHYQADATFRAGRIAVTATVNSPQAMEAIDILVDKVESQISRAKTRLSEKKGSGLGKDQAIQDEGELTDDAEDEDEDETTGQEQAAQA